MPVQDILDDTRKQMEQSLDYYKNQISRIRTGRASTSLLDGVYVDYYGSSTPLNQIANVSTPDARTIVINPYDKSMIQAIEKAIQTADLGFNPQSDGNIIRVPVPPLTEERRKEFVKLAKKYAEEGKVAIRNIRRDAMEELKKEEKNKVITEDDQKKGSDQLQKITDEFISKLDKIVADKEKELLEG
ncbi:MAG TPA: ribosome recycling factor [Candidatus Kapabacteria bacterium]|nr:ribosome recycling factor [Candidatus Kapabacteria bacterium]HOV92330.1 ribosome recycling factor [Candidatus Kapabacteria bacterium]